MTRGAILAAVLGLGMALWSHASFAEGGLAVGLPNDDPGNGFVYGISVNKPSAAEAESSAIQLCRGADIRDTSRARAACKLIETFHDQCANAAFNGDPNTPSTAVGWGIGPDSATANSRAMAQCNTVRKGSGKACHPDGNPACDGTAK